ncbi:MAG: hypothetical protein KKD44_27360, partial [Proteobacteria bacterium]|nr:hypothetical protein [Pseudomonadota bacterium]
ATAWQTSTFTTGNTGRLCDFTLQVDSERWGTNFKGASVPNTNSDYVFFQNGAMPYVESASIDVAGSPESAWGWEYDTTFHDSIGSNDATPTFRTTSSDADVTAILSSFLPVSQAASDASIADPYTDILLADPTMPSQMYTELTFTNVPGADAANTLLDESDTPRALWWFPFLFISVIILGFMVFDLTKSELFQSIICLSILGFLAVMGPLPFWPVMLLWIPCLGIIMSKKHFSWGG